MHLYNEQEASLIFKVIHIVRRIYLRRFGYEASESIAATIQYELMAKDIVNNNKRVILLSG
jgi:hypothetical protein